MFVKVFNQIYQQYRRIISSIGFWPSLITLGFGLAAVGLLSINDHETMQAIKKNSPYFMVKDEVTARVLLSTIIGGMVSLTVFTFTMVMSMLNRASTNYSPRLLPGLISATHNQVVLGIFLGSIVYCLLVLVTITTPKEPSEVPGVAILIAIMLAVFCLGVFVFFIHSISQSIQISNIIGKVVQETRCALEKLQENESLELTGDELGDPELNLSRTLVSPESGYFQGVTRTTLVNLIHQHELNIQLYHVPGQYLLEGSPLASYDNEISEEVEKEILSCFRFKGTSLISDNFVHGFKQLTEIALRAMSPAINDPGTALTVIDHLTNLLSIRAKIKDREVLSPQNSEYLLIIPSVDFEKLIFFVGAAMRGCSKENVLVLARLITMYQSLLHQATTEARKEAIKSEIKNVLADASCHLTNSADIEFVEKLGERI